MPNVLKVFLENGQDKIIQIRQQNYSQGMLQSCLPFLMLNILKRFLEKGWVVEVNQQIYRCELLILMKLHN